MSKENLIKRVRAAAARHPDDQAVQKLIEKLDLAQQVVKSASKRGREFVDPLAAYREGTLGEDGYTLLLDFPTKLINNDQILKEAFLLHEVAVIVDCLVTLLSALHNEAL